MDGEMQRRRVPVVTVECPWCGRPVELDHSTVACGHCLVVVQLAGEDAIRRLPAHPRAAA